jgi:hypothetical protein
LLFGCDTVKLALLRNIRSEKNVEEISYDVATGKHVTRAMVKREKNTIGAAIVYE